MLYVEISREFFRPADESPDEVMTTFTLFPNAANASTTVRSRGQEAAAERLSSTRRWSGPAVEQRREVEGSVAAGPSAARR